MTASAIIQLKFFVSKSEIEYISKQHIIFTLCKRLKMNNLYNYKYGNNIARVHN